MIRKEILSSQCDSSIVFWRKNRWCTRVRIIGTLSLWWGRNVRSCIWAHVVSDLIVVFTCPILTAVNWPQLACAYNFRLLAPVRQPWPVKKKFHFVFIFMLVSATRSQLYQLICREKRLVFHLSPRDGHAITVSKCLILTAVNSSSYGWLTKC